MIVIKSNSDSLRENSSMVFVASGGTPPYTYSVLPGGAGGSINSSTGLYQSSNSFGIDTIVATDSLLATGQKQVFIRHPIQLFCDVIQKYMGLSSDQIYIYNQKWDIPSDSRLYIAVGVMYSKPFASGKVYDTASGFEETIRVTTQTQLKLDLLSRGMDALFRQDEVVMALKSDYSKRQQGLNGFMICNLPGQFNDLSGEEGASMLTRFNATANIQFSRIKKNQSEYFDNFSEVQVTTEE